MISSKPVEPKRIELVIDQDLKGTKVVIEITRHHAVSGTPRVSHRRLFEGYLTVADARKKATALSVQNGFAGKYEEVVTRNVTSLPPKKTK